MWWVAGFVCAGVGASEVWGVGVGAWGLGWWLGLGVGLGVCRVFGVPGVWLDVVHDCVVARSLKERGSGHAMCCRIGIPAC